MNGIHVLIRTPNGLVVDDFALSLIAEDRSGWFGILPRRENVIAILPPGLLVYRTEDAERFVAVAGGLLSLDSGRCQITTRDAVVSANLSDVATVLDRHLSARRERRALRGTAIDRLVREAQRRLALEVRHGS